MPPAQIPTVEGDSPRPTSASAASFGRRVREIHRRRLREESRGARQNVRRTAWAFHVRAVMDRLVDVRGMLTGVANCDCSASVTAESLYFHITCYICTAAHRFFVADLFLAHVHKYGATNRISIYCLFLTPEPCFVAWVLMYTYSL